MEVPSQQPVVDTFTSLVRRSLPPVGAVGSMLLSFPRAVDEMIASGSVSNAREQVAATERKNAIVAALDEADDSDEPEDSAVPGPARKLAE